MTSEDLSKLAARIDAAIKRSAKGFCRDGDKDLVLKAARIGSALIAQHTPGEIPKDYQIPDAELDRVFANANFGDRTKRQIVLETLLQHAGGFTTGHTAMVICQELGLLGKHYNGVCRLTKRGKRVMYYWNKYTLNTRALDKLMEGME